VEGKVGKLSNDYARVTEQIRFYEQKVDEAQRIAQKLEEEKQTL